MEDVDVGSLAKCVGFWEDIGACNLVLSVIRNGYILPLTEMPLPRVMDNHKSANLHEAFVTEAVEGLLKRGCVQKVDLKDVYICSPLGVVDNGKKVKVDSRSQVSEHSLGNSQI